MSNIPCIFKMYCLINFTDQYYFLLLLSSYRLVSPLLEVIDRMAEDIPYTNSDEEIGLSDGTEELEELKEEEVKRLKEKCLSMEDMSDEESDDDEE